MLDYGLFCWELAGWLCGEHDKGNGCAVRAWAQVQEHISKTLVGLAEKESGQLSQGGVTGKHLIGPKAITRNVFFTLLIITDGFILTNEFTECAVCNVWCLTK